MQKRVTMQGSALGRMAVVAICGVALFLAACSDNREQAQTQPATSSGGQSTAPTTVGQTPAQGTATPPVPAGGSGSCGELLTGKCSECHALTRICEKLGKKSKSRWQRTIDRMIDRGAKLTPEESAILLDCLDKGATNDLQDACR